jgi:predicted nucleic acid-binding protein
MIVVSNTSPLTNLATIGQFDLLRQLYGQVHIPEGVWLELNAGGQHWPGSDEAATAGWVHRHSVGNQALRPHLDGLRRAAGFYISDVVYERALELAQEPGP